ncbi:hypothetical protein PACILC2_21480 [Paenibacillus cisolokensis]|uniref:DNA ligase D polymerase domain-containing protein n=2 Tax=Paenibacillus cisolokensis TaxID=1658519 RepID=A0ABQ4N5Y6_9BACL|nr:non-homologous end-joining DNA ligase [Paenibacillus cisolokensis]GIQ63580.1 hypothetical protein PACILC2_21480 [Paenibacillus cisolokensis]
MRKTGSITVEGHEMTVSNPDKLLWPEAGLTKLAYLEKLVSLSPYLLRYTRGRYLTTIRFPNGIHGKSFYQKNAPQPKPPFVRTAQEGDISYVELDSLPTLLWLGNLACLEFHASFDRIGEPVYPTEWVLDLDPSREEEPRIMEAAALTGELLASLGIASVPKTSGATGVQIIVPLASRLSFDDLRQFGQFVGQYLATKHPSLFTIERLKKNRGTLIYVDYLQHYPGKTIAAPYTPRARVGATVSMPLTWEEVRSGVSPADFHLLNVERRLREKGDPLSGAAGQDLRPVLSFLKQGTKR